MKEKPHPGLCVIFPSRSTSSKYRDEKGTNIDEEILGGTPVFWDTRVPSKNLFDCLEEGEPITDFLEDFPRVDAAQVKALLDMSQAMVINLSKVAHENIA